MIESLTAPASAFTVREACAALGVSESGYYAHRHKDQRLRRQQDARIIPEMKQIFEQNYRCYGSPRLVKGLRKCGVGCGKTRIRRLMQQEGICPKQKRRFRPCTTHSNPHLPIAPNVVAALPPVTAPSQRFHSDITYIPTKEGFLFLAATLDAFTRRCAGWCARDNMETQLVKDAARMAFGTGTGTERVHHSDRGSQYASEGFRTLLKNEDVVQSMSRRGNCYDNALGESFWATVKTECFDNFRDGIPETKAQALQSLFGYIELFYNRERLHSALGYKSPVQFEQDWTRQHFTV
ncbi:Mobile element protein [uncultured Leptolyngbya sp.]|uniref:Mobile element protein n=1 Tax=uncultured Leptolyngbya sp. TaxID=332963 RepID=A0A6J4M0S2_9CYAN|nr:Mobile element protein [uncultured Leptolyngbya sp.]